MPVEVLLETVHGSHLYGLNHPESDLDIYRVLTDASMTERFKGKESAKDYSEGTDITVVGLGEFMRQVSKGVPQALEALFSQVKTVDELTFLSDSYRVNSEATNTYLRTIKSFTLDKRVPNQNKRRVHAVRLTFNFNFLVQYGCFDPHLTKMEAEFMKTVSSMSLEELKCFINDTCIFQVFND